jgi:hypothetical protein
VEAVAVVGNCFFRPLIAVEIIQNNVQLQINTSCSGSKQKKKSKDKAFPVTSLHIAHYINSQITDGGSYEWEQKREIMVFHC